MTNVVDPVPLTPPRFRVVRFLARGGMSAVFVAHDEELNREVVVKAVRARHANRSSARDRLLFEAEVTAGLEHPGVVPVYSKGLDAAGRAYFTMRYIRGERLLDAIRRSRTTAPSVERERFLRRLVDRFVDVCYTVDFAHRRGIAHRDLTPTNVMLGEHGETLVVDWGLARRLDHGTAAGFAEEDASDQWPASARGLRETRIGSSAGTPAYMSPEQASGRWDAFGPASDVFGLGATLYELLTGQAPFEAPDDATSEDLARQVSCPTPRQVDRRVPAALDSVCLKAMMREPGERYPSPIALGNDLARWVAGETVSVSRTAILRDWKRQSPT